MGGGGGAIPHNSYRPFTLVGLRHPDMDLHASFRTGSIFEACDDLLQTGDAYSVEEKHRAMAVVRIVMMSVPQLLFANFLRMLFLSSRSLPWSKPTMCKTRPAGQVRPETRCCPAREMFLNYNTNRLAAYP